MTDDVRERVGDLVVRAANMEPGPAAVALLGEAVALADAHGDDDLAFAARLELVDAAEFSGAIRTALIAFAWCLGMCDRDPASFPETGDILWRCKWAANELNAMADVPAERVEAALADVERRFTRAGAGRGALAKLRWRAAARSGRMDEAARWHTTWRTTPRDELSDCVACDAAAEAHWLVVERGDDAGGLDAARPLLDGELGCSTEPHITLGTVLLPLVRLGRLDEARVAHLRGARMIARNPNFLGAAGDHLRFLARTGNERRGLELLERHLPWLARAESDLDRLLFLGPAALLLRRAAETGVDRVRFAVQGELGTRVPAGPDGSRPVTELAEAVTAMASALAGAFDARNGNRHWSEQLRAELAAEPLAAVPLAPAPPRPARPSPPPAPPEPGPDATAQELFDAADRLDDGGDAERAKAAFERARAAFAGEPLQVAECDRRIGRQLARLHRFADAAARFEQARIVFETAGDAVGVVKSATAGAMSLAESGEVAGALAAQTALVARYDGDGTVAEGIARAGLAFIAWEAGQRDGSETEHRRAVAVLERCDDPEQLAIALGNHAVQLLQAGRTADALDLLERALAAHERFARPADRAGLVLMRGHALWQEGRTDDALASLTEARSEFEKLGLGHQTARAGMALGGLAGQLGLHSVSVEELTLAAERFPPGDEDSLATLRAMLGGALAALDRPWEAAEVLEQARDGFAATGAHDEAAQAGMQLAEVLDATGQPTAAVEEAERARAAFIRAGLPGPAANAAWTAGRLLDQLDRDDAALAAYTAAAAGWEAAGEPLPAAQARGRAGVLLGVLGRGEEGLAEIDGASAVFAGAGAADGVAWCDTNAARVLGGLGRIDDALARCAAAVTSYRETGDGLREAEAQHLAGLLLASANRPEEALPRFRSARDGFAAAGSREGVALCDGALADILTVLGRHTEAAAIERDD